MASTSMVSRSSWPGGSASAPAPGWHTDRAADRRRSTNVAHRAIVRMMALNVTVPDTFSRQLQGIRRVHFVFRDRCDKFPVAADALSSAKRTTRHHRLNSGLAC